MGRFMSATGQFLLATNGQFSRPPTGSFSCPLTPMIVHSHRRARGHRGRRRTRRAELLAAAHRRTAAVAAERRAQRPVGHLHHQGRRLSHHAMSTPEAGRAPAITPAISSSVSCPAPPSRSTSHAPARSTYRRASVEQRSHRHRTVSVRWSKEEGFPHSEPGGGYVQLAATRHVWIPQPAPEPGALCSNGRLCTPTTVIAPPAPTRSSTTRSAKLLGSRRCFSGNTGSDAPPIGEFDPPSTVFTEPMTRSQITTYRSPHAPARVDRAALAAPRNTGAPAGARPGRVAAFGPRTHAQRHAKRAQDQRGGIPPPHRTTSRRRLHRRL